MKHIQYDRRCFVYNIIPTAYQLATSTEIAIFCRERQWTAAVFEGNAGRAGANGDVAYIALARRISLLHILYIIHGHQGRDARGAEETSRRRRRTLLSRSALYLITAKMISAI